MAEFRFLSLLETLARHRVEFIVVGGVAAALDGVALATSDLDIVHSRTPENLSRLMSALTELGAAYRGVGDRRLAPTNSHVATSSHRLLTTRFGDLDLLGSFAGLTHGDLLPHSEQMQVASSCRCWLEKLIWLKERTGRDKDVAALPTLRAALREKQSSS